MAVLIRSAQLADASLVHALIRELAEYEKLLDQMVAAEADIAAALFAGNPRVFCDIAEWNGEPAGFVLWFYNFSTFRGAHGIYLEDLFVRPGFRGNGIGKGLFVALARRALAEGCARLDWAVLDWNAPSIAFYEKLGARPITGWTAYRLTGEALEQLAKT
jgi:GNAT superfamily N-acetyltransferase